MRAQGALTKPSDMYSLIMGDEVDALGRHGKTMFVLGGLDFLYIFGGFEEGAELRRQFSLVENAVYCTWSAIAGVFSKMWKTFLDYLKVNNELAAVHALTTYTCHVESEAPQPGQLPQADAFQEKGVHHRPKSRGTATVPGQLLEAKAFGSSADHCNACGEQEDHICGASFAVGLSNFWSFGVSIIWIASK